MREYLLLALNQLLSYTWIFVLVGIGIACIEEHSVLIKFFNKKTSKQPWYKTLEPLAKRLRTIVIGLMLVLISFALVNGLLSTFHNLMYPEAIPQITSTQEQPSAFFSWLMLDQSYIGIYCVTLTILAGCSLMLSGDTKWLKKVAKILITVMVLLAFTGTLATITITGN